MKNKQVKTPFVIENEKDIELLFEILEEDVNRELTNKKLIKEYVKRKREVKNEK